MHTASSTFIMLKHSTNHLVSYISQLFIQVTNNFNTSLFTIRGTDTNAILDNGIYSCQVVLTIFGIERFAGASTNSTVLFKGMLTLTLYVALSCIGHHQLTIKSPSSISNTQRNSYVHEKDRHEGEYGTRGTAISIPSFM